MAGAWEEPVKPNTTDAPGVALPVVSTSFVGDAVADGLSGEDDGWRGAWFDVEMQENMMARGEWSDSMCDCVEDPILGCLSCCCPCIAVYMTLQKLGRVSTPIGLVSKNNYMFCFFILFCVTFVTGAHELSINAGWMETKVQVRPAHVLIGILSWLLLFITLRGIRDKVRVNESDILSALKSTNYFPLCFSCCFISQVARHVKRFQGFWPQGHGTAAREPHVRVAVAHPVGR
uniref:Uncharacterized protein n=1 Tax=Noctiluca scintillans TaxID=2966 RepID=A0A7S0ZZX5_NOCSC|mmetsp:Transcript_2544/g.7558  ORF Transcript_2544/g.7558 Transcript_2544/m.7558 type:complete len:232 (+) Transcript_2544:56-751(+)